MKIIWRRLVLLISALSVSCYAMIMLLIDYVHPLILLVIGTVMGFVVGKLAAPWCRRWIEE